MNFPSQKVKLRDKRMTNLKEIIGISARKNEFS